MAKRKPKSQPTWTDVKAKLADFDRGALLGLWQHPGASRSTQHDRGRFRQSLTAAKRPAEITVALVGLWWDAKGDWSRALGAYPALSEFPA